MKSTGIVRRVDELGRVVIPKEIRSTLRIKKGDALEIYTDKDALLLKKFSQVEAVNNFIKGCAVSLYEALERPIFICDTDQIITASKKAYNEHIGKNISNELTKIITERKTIFKSKKLASNFIKLFNFDQINYFSQLIVPILNNGELFGAVIVFDEFKDLSDLDIKLARLGADIISKQFA